MTNEETGARSQEPGDGKRRAVGGEGLLRAPGPSFEGQQIAAHAKNGRLRLASIEAGHYGADQGQDFSILNRQSAIGNRQSSRGADP